MTTTKTRRQREAADPTCKLCLFFKRLMAGRPITDDRGASIQPVQLMADNNMQWMRDGRPDGVIGLCPVCTQLLQAYSSAQLQHYYVEKQKASKIIAPGSPDFVVPGLKPLTSR